jgi:hypothetical protein
VLVYAFSPHLYEMLFDNVSHVRRSVSANENAQVRKLVLVKKNIQTRSSTPDTASEAIAGGDNWPSTHQSTIFPLAPKERDLWQKPKADTRWR